MEASWLTSAIASREQSSGVETRMRVLKKVLRKRCFAQHRRTEMADSSNLLASMLVTRKCLFMPFAAPLYSSKHRGMRVKPPCAVRHKPGKVRQMLCSHYLGYDHRTRVRCWESACRNLCCGRSSTLSTAPRGTTEPDSVCGSAQRSSNGIAESCGSAAHNVRVPGALCSRSSAVPGRESVNGRLQMKCFQPETACA